MAVTDTVSYAVRRAVAESRAVANCVRAGMLGIEHPAKLAAGGRAMRRFGLVGGAIGQAAAKHGDATAIVDELGSLTFAELDARSNALANAWRAQGVRAGDGVGILCRNHRGLFDALFAAAKVGAKTLMLNTDFAAPQLRDVCAREGMRVIVRDAEFAGVVDAVEGDVTVFEAWSDGEPGADSLQRLVDSGDRAVPPKPDVQQKIVMLTSGTTGTPKGAPRPMGMSLILPGGLLSKIPYRSGGRTFVAAPLFHSWGLLNATTSIALGATVVTRRRFDPATTLDALAEHRCTAIALVPVMLQRVLALGADEIAKRDLSNLRIIALSGSQLQAELATRAMDVFGDVVYNLYGSTEVSYATIATPKDLREAPGCVGSAPTGTIVEVVGPDGAKLPAGETGRIFVGNLAQFTGYTGGGNKEIVRGLMSSGDVGHFDADGRLWVDGRDDEMIVSGGENLFPREVEELLITHEHVDDIAIIGVEDTDFGQRLRAFVVRSEGSDVTVDDLKDFVRQHLARYKVPRDVFFLDTLPRNPTGKILKRELVKYDDDGNPPASA